MGRPKKLETIIFDAVTQGATERFRSILETAITQELRKQGVPLTNLPMDDLLDHLISGDLQDSFSWKTEEGAQGVLTFSPAVGELVKGAEDFVLAKLGDVLEKTLNKSTKQLLGDHIKRFPEEKTREEIELYGFRKRLELRWGTTLDLFHMLIVMSSELLDQMVSSRHKSKAKKGVHLREVLEGIHGRALRTARAVLVLLKHGMADEAYARWRTLYELSVIADFISNHGEDAAIRYRDHEIVARQRSIDNARKWGYRVHTSEERKEVKAKFQQAVKKYGKGFSISYGWAEPFVSGTSAPRFADLEQDVRGQRTAPPYKQASLQIHGGRAGLYGLGSMDRQTLNTGFSNAGLHIPVMNSSVAILQITNTGLSNSPRDDLIIKKLLVFLDAKIRREARKAARQLELEEQGSLTV